MEIILSTRDAAEFFGVSSKLKKKQREEEVKGYLEKPSRKRMKKKWGKKKCK